MYCIFPTYGQAFGIWAEYDLSWLFRHEDNCDGAEQVPTDFSCNATDFGAVAAADCQIIDFNSVNKVFIKVDRHTNGPATHFGRTYNIYAKITDNCDNGVWRKREVFIPVSEAVYVHYQPCDTGNPLFKTSLPQVLS